MGLLGSSATEFTHTRRFLRRATAAVTTVATLGLLGLTALPASAGTSAGPSKVRLIVRTATALNDTGAASLVARGGGSQHRRIGALHAVVVEVPAAAAAGVQARYKALSGVTSVELDHARKASATPDDPAYPDQWALPKIGWDTAPTVSGAATIAVLDTGVDGTNGDLSARLVPGWSAFLAADGVSAADPTQDPNGHGTWLSSIAAAATDNGSGIAGVAGSGARIMPVQVLGADGQGQDSDVIAGLTYAADHGADVVLMGFSNPTYSQALQDAVEYAWSKGAVVVAATGNDNSTAPTYPAGAAKVVGVSATDTSDALWSGSNSGEDVFLGAPGVGVLADAVGGGTKSVTGTSASAAIVAGAVALLKGADAGATPGTIVGRLARNADPAGTVADSGNGRVNVARALADTSTAEVVPVGTNGALSGGPFVGPYVSAASFDATLEGQSRTPCTSGPGCVGSGPWQTNALTNWRELEVIPLRVHLVNTANTANVQVVAVDFDHTQGGTTPGIQNLAGFSAGTGVTITSAPVLSTPAGDKWTYTFTVSVAKNTDSAVTFSGMMAAGAHLSSGNSLALGGSPSLGTLPINKPQISATDPKPDLAITKTGPTTAGLAQSVTYTLSYQNKSATVTATQPQITDTLPAGLSFVSCTGGCTQVGNTLSWALAPLAPGASGSVTVTATMPATGASGATFTDTAQVAPANQDDLNTNDNTATKTTTLSFNSAPVAVNNSYSTTEDSALTTATAATGVLGNDTDADGNTLTAIKVANPLHGAVTLNANGTFTYTPTANYNGPDSFTYKANDGSSDSNTATVNIAVAPVNDAPNASNGTVSVTAGGSSAVTLVGSDVETAAGSLTYTTGTAPTHGTLTGTGSSRTYTPAAGYTGTDSFTFTVTDRGDPDNCGSVVAGTCTAALTSSPATVSITVTAQGTSTSVTPASATYGDASVTLSALVSAGAGTATATAGSVTFTVKSGATTIGTATSGNVNGSGLASVSYAIPAGTAAGGYTVAATYNAGGGFSGSSATGSLTIDKAPLGIAAADKSKVYGAANPSLTGSVSGIRNGDAITASYSTVATQASGVGGYAIVPAAVDSSPGTLANYTLTLTNGTLSVGRAALTVTADPQSRTYGAANPALTVSYDGFVLGQNASVLGGTLGVVTPAAATSVVGAYAITASGLSSANYVIGYVAGTLTVTKAALSVTADNQTKVYGTANPVLTGTLAGVLNGDAITASYSALADDTSSVDTYAISAALADPDSRLGNYTVTNNPGVLSVTAASLVVTPAAASRTYGSANPVFTGSITGVVNGDGITATYGSAALAGSAVGGYAIVATLVDPSSRASNYAVTLNSGVLTVEKAALSVVVDSKNKSYGAANPSLTGTLTGVVNSDVITASYSTTATATSGVGSYSINATLADPGTKLGNYSITNTAGQLVVSTADLVVTANNATRLYGSANPVLEGVVTGIQNGDGITATYDTDAVATSPVGGSYSIIPTLHGDTSNYTVQVNNGSLSVTKAPLSVTAANMTKVYGTANPALTGTLSGVVNGDAITASYSTLAGPTSSVGNYGITAALADPDSKLGNYQISNNPGSLSITAADLVVTPAGANRTYGATNPAFTGTITGVVSGDGITATYASSATAASGVGTYAIDATLVDPNSKVANYSVTLNSGILTVERAALSVVVDDQTKTYGAASPALTGTLTGVLNSDPITVSYATTATAASHVVAGGYPITATLADPGNKLGNYTLTNTPATLTITKAALTVTATNTTKVYGDANPAFTAGYTGLVNSDTPAALGGTLAYATTATTATGVGTYPITPSGLTSTDYTITYAPGQLTITGAGLTITAAAKSKTYGDANPALTGTITGLKNGDAITASYATTATNTSNVGIYPITPTAIDSTPGTLANYNLTLANATLTINKAALTITVDNKSAQYSDPSPALTVHVTGYVLGDDASALGGTQTLSTTRTALGLNSQAGTYPITGYGATSANYTISYVPGIFTVTQEDAALVYTGDSLISTGSTATNSTRTVQLSASVTEAPDGNLGNQLGNQSVVFTVSGFNGAAAGSCTARITVPATYAGSGIATCSVTLGEGNYTVDMFLVANSYYLAPHETGAVTVVLAGTGFTTGGGWIREPTLGTKSNLGFTVKYLKNGNVQGNSLYIYRKTLGASQVANPAGGFLPAGEYNWIVKSNSMTGLTQKCPTGTLIGCTATFTGKSTITAANRTTGLQYSLGGNNSFQVDVTDKGEPGSSSSTNPDTYALRVWDATGTYYQLGTPAGQLSLNGGNIQVRP